VAKNMAGITLCALADFAANPVIHTIKNFPEDFEQHVKPKEVEEAKKPAARGERRGRRAEPAGD
jgi:hypothetical protein